MALDSANSLRASLEAGDRSAEEVVREHLERIAATHPILNAAVELDIAGVLDEARKADARRASGEPLGPLHGVPVTVKDSIDVAGFHCTAGVRGARDRRPERDAPAVARLRAAGAIIVAKTNLP